MTDEEWHLLKNPKGETSIAYHKDYYVHMIIEKTNEEVQDLYILGYMVFHEIDVLKFPITIDELIRITKIEIKTRRININYIHTRFEEIFKRHKNHPVIMFMIKYERKLHD